MSPAWAMLEYGWYPLLLFAATPWFLQRLGSEQYGHWMLLTAAVGFGGVLNTGTGSATIKAVSAGMGRAAPGETERTIGASLALALIGGSALALLIFAAFWFAGDTWLSRMGDPALVQLTGAAAAVLVWLEQLDNVFSSAMKGAEQFGRAARVEVCSKTAQVFAAAMVLGPWPTLPALYSALLLVAVLRLLAKAITAKQLLGLSNLRLSLTGASEVLHFAKWGWLQGVGGVLFGVADRMLVGSLLGATSLAHYSIASQLAMQIHAASAAGLSVIFPIVSRKLEARDKFSLRRVAMLAWIGNLAVSGSMSLALILFGPVLLASWLGPVQAEPVIQVFPYLIFAYLLLALSVTPHYILLSLGRIRFVAISNLVAGCVFVLAVAMIAPRYGLVGVALARSLYGLIIMVNLIPLIDRLRQVERA